MGAAIKYIILAAMSIALINVFIFLAVFGLTKFLPVAVCGPL